MILTGDCAGSSLLHGLFSSCDELGLLFLAVCRLLIAMASLFVEHVNSVVVVPRLQSTASVVVVHGLSCSVARGILDQGLNMGLLH